MSAAEQRLYSALFLFFRSLAINPRTGLYFQKPALTENGTLVEFTNDIVCTEFFPLKSAVSTLRESVSDINDFIEEKSDENLAALLAFFEEMIQCSTSYQPMFAPMYIKPSKDLNVPPKIHDAKALYVALMQIPNGLMAKVINRKKCIMVNQLFEAMQNFSKMIANIDDKLLQEKFGLDLNRIQQWQSLPSMHMQILFWQSYSNVSDRKKNRYLETPPVFVFIALAWMHKGYTYVCYSDEEYEKFNSNIYIPFIFIPSLVLSMIQAYFRDFHYHQVLNHDEKVKATEQRIIQMGEYIMQINSGSGLNRLLVQSSIRNLLQTAEVNDKNLTEDERETLGMGPKK
ncbi:MAG: hypothetical protein ABSF18_04475 [Gammaproteobacteria bacterium]|jgi:hypothetical protein